MNTFQPWQFCLPSTQNLFEQKKKGGGEVGGILIQESLATGLVIRCTPMNWTLLGKRLPPQRLLAIKNNLCKDIQDYSFSVKKALLGKSFPDEAFLFTQQILEHETCRNERTCSSEMAQLHQTLLLLAEVTKTRAFSLDRVNLQSDF